MKDIISFYKLNHQIDFQGLNVLQIYYTDFDRFLEIYQNSDYDVYVIPASINLWKKIKEKGFSYTLILPSTEELTTSLESISKIDRKSMSDFVKMSETLLQEEFRDFHNGSIYVDNDSIPKTIYEILKGNHCE